MMVITSLVLKWLYEQSKVASESHRPPSITIMFRHKSKSFNDYDVSRVLFKKSERYLIVLF